MKYSIRGEKLEVSKSLKDYVLEKLGRIDKYLIDPESVEVKVLLSSKKLDKKIEITLFLNNYIVRAEEIHLDMYAAIDLVIEKLEKQIMKYKSKISGKHNKQLIEFDNDEITEALEEEIVKVKKVFLKPMSKDEALTQMELLSHTFFVFKDSEDLNVKVVYKRKDGKYGIIESE